MSLNQQTLRSFINSDGKLVLCNEPFFNYFGHCQQHLIGRSVSDVFSLSEGLELLQAVQCCQLHPEQSFTVDMEKKCTGGCNTFRWSIYAERKNGQLAGVHLVGEALKAETTA